MSDPLFFEDLRVGQLWTTQGRTVTQADIVNFASMTGDFNPLHVNEEFAKQGLFGKIIAHGLMGIAWAAGLSSQNPHVRTAAFVSIGEWRFVKPVFIGDTLRTETEVVALDERPRRRHGRVLWLLRVINQRNEIAQVGNFETLVYRNTSDATASTRVDSEHSNRSLLADQPNANRSRSFQ